MKRSRNSGVTSKRSGKLSAARHDRDVDLALLPAAPTAWPGTPSIELQLDALVAHVEVGQQAGEAARPDRAHDADLQMGVVQAQESRRLVAHAAQLVHDLLETRPQQLAEIGDMGEVALAAEQQPADLVLELLDGAAQRRLGDIALLRRAREIARFADGQEIPDVMNVHTGPNTKCMPASSGPRAIFSQCNSSIDFIA